MADKTPTLASRALLLALLSGITLGACAQTPPSAPLRHGIVQFDGEGSVFLVTAQPAPVQGTVYFQVPNKQGDAACCKQLPVSAFKAIKAPPGTATDEVSGKEPVMLRGKVPRTDAPMPFVGAAVVGDVQSARLAPGGGISAQAKDGRTSTSSTCISEEGFHVMEKGAKAKAPMLTHLYVSLGYEIDETTCK